MRAMSGTNGSSGFGSVSNEHIDKRTKREKEKITYFSSTMELLNNEVLGITILFTPVIVRYIEKTLIQRNLVLANKFCQSLGSSLYM